MSTRTEEVRTVFRWDTTDVDRGVKRMETALDRVKQAEKGAARNGHGSNGSGNNLAMGVRDLAEGRGVNAMQRFGHTIGATAFRLAGYMLALRAAGEATRYLREEMEKTDTASRRLEASFLASNRTMTFSTTGEGTGSIGGKIEALQASQKEEKEHQSGAASAGAMLDAMKRGNPLSAAAAHAIEAYSAFQGKRSPQEEQAASEQRGAEYAKEEKRHKGLYRSSLYGEAAGARFAAPGHDNDPFSGRRRTLDLQEEKELSEVKKVMGEQDEASLQIVREKYEWLRKTVDAEERIVHSRHNAQSRQLAIQGGGQAAFGKKLSLAGDRVAESQRLLAGDDLTAEQRRGEQLNLQRAQNDQREAIMGRFLNPDGSKRRHGAILRDFRRDRREEKLRNRFLRQFERGGFDPATGRRVTTHSDGGESRLRGDEVGLHAGGMAGGAGAWRDLFPKKESKAEKEAKAALEAAKFQVKIFEVLDDRLPKGTN